MFTYVYLGEISWRNSKNTSFGIKVSPMSKVLYGWPWWVWPYNNKQWLLNKIFICILNKIIYYY